MVKTLLDLVAPKGTVGFRREAHTVNSLAACVFGDGLGSFTDGVFGQFTRQKQPDGGLDLARADGGFLVVVSQAGSFTSDALEDIVDKGVHDAHGFAGDTSVRVNLLQHFVDVDGIAFLSLSLSLLLCAIGDRLCLSGFLFAFLSSYFGCHYCLSEGYGPPDGSFPYLC